MEDLVHDAVDLVYGYGLRCVWELVFLSETVLLLPTRSIVVEVTQMVLLVVNHSFF